MTHLSRRRALQQGLGLGAAALASPWVHAQTPWPNKPIALVVTYPPGGGADAMARLIAPRLAEFLGQSVVVENKPGASGQIGAQAVLKAPADGHTVMLDAASFAVNPALFAKLPYDTAKAFRTLGVMALYPHVVLVHPQFPAQSLHELIQIARSKHGALSYASSGNGSAQHLAGALFESVAQVDMVHIPYKGGGPALNDVIGGQVPVFFGNLASTLQHIQSGRLRALALTADQRSPILPQLPTLSELGLQGADVYEWNGLFAPAGVPERIAELWVQAFQQAKDAPDVRARVAQLGGQMFKPGQKPAHAFVSAQMNLWSKVIQDRRITLE